MRGFRKNKFYLNGQGKHGGFTLIELLSVIALIGIISAILLPTLNKGSAKSRDTRRLSDINQLERAFSLYSANNDFNFPPVPNSNAYCLGVAYGETCWGDRNVAGSDILINSLKPYISIPTDPSPNRGWGDRYAYVDGGLYRGCSTLLTGKWILWRPEKGTPTNDTDCLNRGIFACCPAGGICGNDGGYFCAYKLD